MSLYGAHPKQAVVSHTVLTTVSTSIVIPTGIEGITSVVAFKTAAGVLSLMTAATVDAATGIVTVFGPAAVGNTITVLLSVAQTGDGVVET